MKSKDFRCCKGFQWIPVFLRAWHEGHCLDPHVSSVIPSNIMITEILYILAHNLYVPNSKENWRISISWGGEKGRKKKRGEEEEEKEVMSLVYHAKFSIQTFWCVFNKHGNSLSNKWSSTWVIFSSDISPLSSLNIEHFQMTVLP